MFTFHISNIFNIIPLNESKYVQFSSHYVLGISNYRTTNVLIQNGNPIFWEFFFLYSLAHT